MHEFHICLYQCQQSEIKSHMKQFYVSPVRRPLGQLYYIKARTICKRHASIKNTKNTLHWITAVNLNNSTPNASICL